MQTQPFNTKLSHPKGETMVIAHRGDWHYAPENTLEAISNAIDLNIDMVEIDVKKTLDGKLILMHDDTVDRMTSGNGRIKDLSYDVIRSFQVKQSQGVGEAPYTDSHVPTFEEVMRLVSGKIMVNLDQCWEFREEVYQVLLETNTVHQALFKSKALIEEVEQFLNSKDLRPLYMHMVGVENYQGDLNTDMDTLFDKVNPVAIELNFKNRELSHYNMDKISEHLSGKCRIWANTLDFLYHYGSLDEELLQDLEAGWEWCLSHDVNMIQTDNARQLLKYMQK